MPFAWAGCLDGSSINVNMVEAFAVGQVQKHDSEGRPMFNETDPEKKEPIMQMCVFAIIRHREFPVRLVGSMQEAQITIQAILGKLKSDYDKERGAVQVATAEEKSALKLG